VFNNCLKAWRENKNEHSPIPANSFWNREPRKHKLSPPDQLPGNQRLASLLWFTGAEEVLCCGQFVHIAVSRQMLEFFLEKELLLRENISRDLLIMQRNS
jgi:hypothetical protein